MRNLDTNPPVSTRALVLAPHPDDEALGCGGTLLLMNRGGTATTTVYATCGERLYGEPSADVASARKSEATEASRMLGCLEPLFLDLADGGLQASRNDLYLRLNYVIRQIQPDIVFAPSPVDHHEDHTLLAAVALNLFNSLGNFALAFYEVYATVRFNKLVDITHVVEEKKRVLSHYRVSLFGKPDIYIDSILGLNAQRSLYLQQEGYYEGFLILKEPTEAEDIVTWLTFGFAAKV